MLIESIVANERDHPGIGSNPDRAVHGHALRCCARSSYHLIGGAAAWVISSRQVTGQNTGSVDPAQRLFSGFQIQSPTIDPKSLYTGATSTNPLLPQHPLPYP